MPRLTRQQEKQRKNSFAQSILIPVTYGLDNVCPMVLSLGYNCFYIDETKNYYRVRQFNPRKKYKKYATISIRQYPGAKYVVQF